MPPPPPPPPPLMDELVEEVLLRLPPDSPASLVRAGLVCKRWCHLVSDPGFQRRLLDFHGQAPPMLGFLTYSDGPTSSAVGTRFVPTTSASASGSSSGLPHADHYGCRPCDSRHGRVLLRLYGSMGIIIWNPITGEQLELPTPPPTATSHQCNWTAAVLCAATVTGEYCSHLNCHRRGHFLVVVVGDTIFNEKFTCIYSSEAGVWSEPVVAAPHSDDDDDYSAIATWIRSILVRNTSLYFGLESQKSILEYNLCTRGTSVIKLPRAGKNKKSKLYFGRIQLTTMEDGRLGFVRLLEEDFSRLLRLWSREDEEPAAGWVLSKVIELDKLLPLDDRRPSACFLHYLVGSAEGVGTIFIKSKHELFTVDLRSGRVNKVLTHLGLCFGKVVVPYVNLCTPVFREPSTLDGPRTSTSIK